MTKINTSRKPYIIIGISIVMGFMIGYFVNGMVNHKRINQLIKMNTEQGIRERYMSLLNPNEIQKPGIDSIIMEYASKNHSLLQAYSDSINNLKLELRKKLEGKLDPAQRKKIKDSKMLQINPVKNDRVGVKQEKYGKRIMNLIEKDSISKILIDSLKLRRKEIRKAMVDQKIDERLDVKTEKLKADLNLTDEQVHALKEIHKRYTLQLLEIRKDTTLLPRQKIVEVRSLKQSLFDEVRPLLDKQQFEKYKEITVETFKEKYKSEKNK